MNMRLLPVVVLGLIATSWIAHRQDPDTGAGVFDENDDPRIGGAGFAITSQRQRLQRPGLRVRRQ